MRGDLIAAGLFTVTLVASMFTTPHMTFNDYVMLSISVALWTIATKGK